jgi:hypothetical protein
MARPTNKDELLAAAEHEFAKLWKAIDLIEPTDREQPGACENWSVKDLLAHLDAWHEMYLGWEKAGSTGEPAAMPASGYSWGETPALNLAIYERTKNDGWKNVNERVRISHQKVLDVVKSYRNDDLFTKKRYGWTGTTSVASYTISASASHYAWASKLIRKWAKTRIGQDT